MENEHSEKDSRAARRATKALVDRAVALIRQRPGIGRQDLEDELGVKIGFGGIPLPLTQVQYRALGWWPKSSVDPNEAVNPADVWASQTVITRLKAISMTLHHPPPLDQLISDLEAQS